MIRIFSSLFLVAIVSLAATAQSLYMPRNIQKAFAKGTRSADGNPGKNYWQNFGRYDISVTAAPPDRNIKGSEKITYVNNSPDTLKSLIIKLIPNIHLPGAIRYADANADYLTTGMHIDQFNINGQAADWSDPEGHYTWQGIRLPGRLLPHDSVKLNIDWHYQVSLQSNREGMIDSTTYFLAYFYPRVAVYDDYYGWDLLDFTDQQEFYNDFNDYTLNVTVPKNYIVWATGNLQNPDAVLQAPFAKKLKESLVSDAITTIASKEEVLAKKVTTQQAMNTWQWTASNISDVTFGLSDHFVWDASSVVVDDATKRRASVQAAYNDTAKDYHQMVSFAKHALDWFSHNWPGVPYPFNKTTIFQGYADMEYPMMVNDGTQQDPLFSRFIVEHEIAHTWFPFYMGINEARYGFMDEGWATTFELLIGRVDLGNETAEHFYKQFRVNGWIYDPAAEEDLPIVTPANVLRGAAYGNNAYGKPSLGYFAVKDILGDETFKKCLHDYISRWHGKHPVPWDFFNSFNTSAGKNLNWFWSSWFFSNGYIDLSLQNADKTDRGYKITIQNIGGYPVPVDIVLTYADGTTETLHQTPTIWAEDQKQAVVLVNTSKQIKKAELKTGIFVDANESNNSWQAK